MNPKNSSSGMDPNEIARTIESLVTRHTDKNYGRMFKRGTISTAYFSSQKADVQVEGNPNPTLNVPCFGYYRPRPGDKVLLLSIGNTGANLLILGPINATERQWITPALLNGWIRYDTTYTAPGYFRDALGIVHVRGMMKNGTINAPIFVLPSGYRPNQRLLMPAVSNNGIGRIDITPAGEVIPNVGSNAWFSLDNIHFPSEA